MAFVKEAKTRKESIKRKRQMIITFSDLLTDPEEIELRQDQCNMFLSKEHNGHTVGAGDNFAIAYYENPPPSDLVDVFRLSFNTFFKDFKKFEKDINNNTCQHHGIMLKLERPLLTEAMTKFSKILEYVPEEQFDEYAMDLEKLDVYFEQCLEVFSKILLRSDGAVEQTVRHAFKIFGFKVVDLDTDVPKWLDIHNEYDTSDTGSGVNMSIRQNLARKEAYTLLKRYYEHRDRFEHNKKDHGVMNKLQQKLSAAKVEFKALMNEGWSETAIGVLVYEQTTEELYGSKDGSANAEHQIPISQLLVLESLPDERKCMNVLIKHWEGYMEAQDVKLLRVLQENADFHEDYLRPEGWLFYESFGGQWLKKISSD